MNKTKKRRGEGGRKEEEEGVKTLGGPREWPSRGKATKRPKGSVHFQGN